MFFLHKDEVATYTMSYTKTTVIHITTWNSPKNIHICISIKSRTQSDVDGLVFQWQSNASSQVKDSNKTSIIFKEAFRGILNNAFRAFDLQLSSNSRYVCELRVLGKPPTKKRNAQKFLRSQSFKYLSTNV